MASSSQGEQRLRRPKRGTAREPTRARVRRWLRRTVRSRAAPAPCPTAVGPLPPLGPLARVRRVIERGLQIGVTCGLPMDAQKRTRLCNLLALWGTASMVPWFAVELLFGESRNFPSEVGSLVGFVA